MSKNTCNSIIVAGQDMNLIFGSYIPHLKTTIRKKEAIIGMDTLATESLPPETNTSIEG